MVSRHETDPAAASLHKLAETYDVGDTEFLTDAYAIGLLALIKTILSSGTLHREVNALDDVA